MDDITPPQEILIINVSRIGDTLLATPAIRSIAQHWPQARITVLGHPKRVEVLQNIPFIHRVDGINNTQSLWRGRVGGKSFNLAFVFGEDQPLLRYALRVAKKVVAFRQRDDAINSRLYRCVEPAIPRSVHDAELRLVLTDALGIPRADRHLSYQVSVDETNWAQEKLAIDIGDAASKHRPLIGLQIASFPTKAYRDWPLENFSQLCVRILAHWPSAHFIIFGGELELARTRELYRQFSSHATHYAGQLTLRQTAAIMQQLDLYIGVDTGPTHIAGALDITMVALYHPYLPAWRVAPPARDGLHVVDHPLVKNDPGPETSMADISVDQVWSAVVKAMPADYPSTVALDTSR
jgi:heptosyltransferase-3